MYHVHLLSEAFWVWLFLLLYDMYVYFCSSVVCVQFYHKQINCNDVCYGQCCEWWCLMCVLTGVYSAESVTDSSWLCMSLGLVFLYHFVILQGLGLVPYHQLSLLLYFHPSSLTWMSLYSTICRKWWEVHGVMWLGRC